MKFGYTIVYVSDVPSTLAFFEKAFGLKTKLLHETAYGELATGETTLAFASHEMGKNNLPDGYITADSSLQPLGIEVALVTDDVATAHERAVKSGAVSIKDPAVKPWGQTVSYVRCPDGILIELCSPTSA